ENSPVTHLLRGEDRSGFYSFLQGFGVDKDPDNVFTLTNGTLRISGQHYGYLATKQPFENYRLVAEFKWGEQTWAPRLTNACDSGKVGISVNGQKTLEGTNAIPHAGKIVLQSEGAEIFFRRLDLYPLK